MILIIPSTENKPKLSIFVMKYLYTHYQEEKKKIIVFVCLFVFLRGPNIAKLFGLKEKSVIKISVVSEKCSLNTV